MSSKTILNYTEQNSTQTLAEGLAEYMDTFKNILLNNSQDTERSHLLLRHDYTHVLFGSIPFELRGESITDIWTIFGTDLGFKGYLNLIKHFDADVIKQYYFKHYGGKFKAYWHMALLTPDMLKTMYRGITMKKKWPFENPQQYDNITLNELREKFGIKILNAYLNRDEEGRN